MVVGGGKGKGRGYKTNKPQRGGGKHFTRHLQPLEKAETGSEERPGMWEARESKEGDDKNGSEEEDDSEEDDSEEGDSEEDDSEEEESESEEDGSDDEDAVPSSRKAPTPKVKKSAEISIENPNRVTKKATKVSEISTDVPRELSRREREEKEKEEAKARYWKLHVAGKTEQAQSDLARLAVIRKQREEAAKQREAEKAAREEAAKKKP
ncbi:casein kinase substrate phospho protein PP28-domain-containing protein [Endogone sp. FLAS-F59071]|nr:casein kinase substrate phospho protein PP28-domain-containing protein [Endogone sp. FLAS-F59071]|eukprot:RUS16444.1 casein kinase substrate phospho protein PP28-domain-containing protein [Endogone sp. FLAS-F59071]